MALLHDTEIALSTHFILILPYPLYLQDASLSEDAEKLLGG